MTVIGAILTTVLIYIARSIPEMKKDISQIRNANAVQTENICTYGKVLRGVVRCLRSHSYALKEAGANGSTEVAHRIANETEDLLVAQQQRNEQYAMGGMDDKRVG